MTDLSRLPGPVLDIWDWQHSAACCGKDSDVFFHPPRERGLARAARTERAKQICRSCPVIVQCRQHALNVREPYGIWGGLDEDELRAAIRRRRSQCAIPGQSDVDTEGTRHVG